MAGRLITWPRVILTVLLAALLGAGAWLAVATAGSEGRPAPGGSGQPVASAAPAPPLDLQSLPTTGPAARPASCGPPALAGASGAWLPDWLDDPNQPSLIAGQASGLRLLDFFWLGLGASPDSVTVSPGNPGGSSLDAMLAAAAAANPCGLRFLTVSDELAPKSVLARILLDPAARWRQVTALATVMARYPQAGGLTLDYEYALPASQADLDLYASAAHWRGLSDRAEIGRITAGYTEFVRELGLAMHRQHRALRVAVRVRTTDEIGYSDLSGLPPFLFDYGALARYCDQIVLMAIDFHWSTGDPGPITTLADLRGVLAVVRGYRIPAGRLAVESAVYGYDWTLDARGHRLAGTQAATVTASGLAARGWTAAGGRDGETYYEYTAGGRRHAVWFAGSGLRYQAAQIRRLWPGAAVMAWAAGNTDPAGSALILAALGQ